MRIFAGPQASYAKGSRQPLSQFVGLWVCGFVRCALGCSCMVDRGFQALSAPIGSSALAQALWSSQAMYICAIVVVGQVAVAASLAGLLL
jgi:hypothetical protein